ncbi:hypothetical protein HDU97_008129 [Phlyctochytrium planicorne]|nr:hypothetical protein HDU97_008129 [Phlyctochytrium planicorne]
MVKVSWSPILASSITLVKSSIEDDLFYSILNTYQQYTTAVGLLGLSTYRDNLIGSLCRISLPPNTAGTSDIAIVAKEISQFSMISGQAFINKLLNVQNGILDERGVMCLRTVLAIVSNLTEVLDERAWFFALETLQCADNLVSSGRLGKKELSSGALLKDDAFKELSKVRPAAGAQSIDNHYISLQVLIRKLFESSNGFKDSCFDGFVRGLCRLAKETAAASGNATGSRPDAKLTEEKAFSLIHLTEVMVANISRILRPNFDLWEYSLLQMVEIAHSANTSAAFRVFTCNAFGDIVIAGIQFAKIEEGSEIEKVLFSPLQRLMGVPQSLPVTTPLSAEKPILDDDKPFRNIWFAEVQRCGLETLNKILQTNGHKLVDGWPIVFEIIRSVFGISKNKRMDSLKPLSAGIFSDQSGIESLPAVGKITTLVRVSFPSLQLICNDFLTSLDPLLIYDCIETLSCFGSFPEDVNISLTAVGLLWSISDHVLSKRQVLEQESKANSQMGSFTELRPEKKHELQLKVPAENLLSHTWTTGNTDVLWMHLLANLSQLCSDGRPEVRNSANQSLFRTISTNGRKLTLDAWDECIWNVLFPLLERVKVSSERVELMIRMQSSGEGPFIKETRSNSVSVHHSRNTAAKQWDETKVLTLNGVTTSIITFFPVLIDLAEGFDRAWNLFLDYIKAWCLSGSTEVAVASLKSFKTLIRYPKDTPSAEADPKIQAFIEKRQKSLWRVAWDIWEGIGESLAFAEEPESTSESLPGSKETLNSGRHGSFPPALRASYGSLTQETLVLFLSLFPEIFEIIRSSFGLFELRKFYSICSYLVLYHNVFPADTSTTRWRADHVNDLENCSPLQSAILDYVSGNKVSFSGIRGEPEATLQVLASFIRYPFINKLKADSNPSIASPRSESNAQSFTYMALGKKSIQLLTTAFIDHSTVASIYSSGTFEFILGALSVPMKAKYNCPSPGVKDSTPLWRAAANTSVSVVQIGLQNIKLHLKEISQVSLLQIYKGVVEMFDGFLLTSSVPHSSISPEELAVDEDFDVSVLETLKVDVFGHFGCDHVPDEILKDMASVIVRGTKLYSKLLASPISIEDDDLGLRKGVFEGSRNNSVTERHVLKPAIHASTAQLRNASRPGSTRASTSALDTSQPTLEVQKRSDSIQKTQDILPVSRHNFAVQCISILFALCSVFDGEDQARFRVAKIVAPLLVEKICSVLRSYVADRPYYSKHPFPSLRNEEVLIFLANSKETNLQPDVLMDSTADKLSLRYLVRKGPKAHLYIMYPDLCEVLCCLARCGKTPSISSEDDEKIITLTRACLAVIGADLGIETVVQ